MAGIFPAEAIHNLASRSTHFTDLSYPLTRDAQETIRLNSQHALHVRGVGYLLHPLIEKRLGPNACIADLACGTGAMALDLAQALPKTVQIEGIDLSSSQFPSSAVTPSNVHFRTGNVKEPFPEDMKEKYDLVSIRTLVAALEPDDWEKVARNVLAILKPGGAIQWLESNFFEAYPAVRLNPGVSSKNIDKIGQIASRLIKGRIELAPAYLHAALSTTGYQGLEVDVACVDRLPEDRTAIAHTYFAAGLNVLQWACAEGVLDAPSLQEIEALRAGASREIDAGVFPQYKLRTHVAFKSV